MTVLSVLFDWNLSRCPFLRQIVDLEIGIRILDLLLCTGFDLVHTDLYLCLIFTQRSMNDQKIERSHYYYCGLQHSFAKSIEISFPI